MKNLPLTIVAVIGCLCMQLRAFAQKPTLESLLPASLQKSLPGLREDYAFVMGKVAALNPGYKEKKQLAANFNTAFAQLKEQKPAYKSIQPPTITTTSYDQLIAAKTKQLGAKSGVVRILTSLKDSITEAESSDQVISAMVSLLRSPVFAALSAEDKNMFYNAFAAGKVALDYAAKNNIVAAVIYPFSKMGVGGYIAGGDDDDDFDFLPMRQATCHWLCTMAGAVAGGAAGGPGGACFGAAVGFLAGAALC